MMRVSRHIAAAAVSSVLVATAASPGRAQVVGLGTTIAGVGALPNACTQMQSHAAIAGDAVVDWTLARVGWSGGLASNGGQSRSVWHAQVFTPEWRGLQLDVASERVQGGAVCDERSLLARYSTGVTVGWERAGISLRYVKRILRDSDGIAADTFSRRTWGPSTRGVSLAAWRNIGPAVLALSLGARSQWREQRQQVLRPSGVDTIPSDSGPIIIPRPGPTYETQLQRGLVHAFGSELQVSWASGRLAVNALAGHSLGGRSFTRNRFWGHSDASFALTPTIALVGGYVLDDGWDTQRLTARRYFTLGARLTSAPFAKPLEAAAVAPRASVAGFTLLVGGDGLVTLRVRAATARLVELTGDFVQWRPVRLQRVSADWWELRMAIAPGVHRVNLRIDGGAWNAPPGLPRQRDEFGGDAGIFTIS